jgi:hypothetical protein
MGIDVGKDKSASVIGRSLREGAKYEGVLLLDDIHGLCVFPEDLPVRFVSISASVEIGQSAGKFVEEFLKAYELSPEFSSKQSLALELYSLSHFESSLRARFLTLISSVECLSSPEQKGESVIAHLDNLIDMTKQSLQCPETDSIISQLGDLKKESISSSCRKLIARYLGQDAAKLFNNCYDIRSKLVHKGDAPEGINLGVYTPQLDELVSQLIVAAVTNR